MISRLLQLWKWVFNGDSAEAVSMLVRECVRVIDLKNINAFQLREIDSKIQSSTKWISKMLAKCGTVHGFYLLLLCRILPPIKPSEMDASQSDFFGFSVFLKSWIFMGHKAQCEIVLGHMSTQCTLSSWCAHNKDKMNFRGEWTLLVANLCSVNRWKCFTVSEKFVLIPEFCKFALLTNLQRGEKKGNEAEGLVSSEINLSCHINTHAPYHIYIVWSVSS